MGQVEEEDIIRTLTLKVKWGCIVVFIMMITINIRPPKYYHRPRENYHPKEPKVDIPYSMVKTMYENI